LSILVLKGVEIMIVIVGESASGKSTLARSIVEKSKDLKLVVTYTTRPPRDGEIDGIDYHFVSDECFEQMIKDCKFVEYTTYRGWYYGTAASDCLSEKSVVVLNPTGLRAVKRIGYEVTSIYLNVDRRSRLIKMLNRGDNIEEAYRRSLSDEGQFAEIGRETTAVLDNPKYQHSVEELTNQALAIINAAGMKKFMSKLVGEE
jgi:guanylate kinase